MISLIWANMITHNGKQVTLAMRNRKAINLIARNGKAMWDIGGGTGIRGAAAAVILAEYGKQVWSDVKQYAKAHPQIVEFINQDPHLAASISPNSAKIRGIYTDGTAYAKTNIVPDSTTKVKCQVLRTATGNYKYIFGSKGSAGKSSYYFVGANGSTWYHEVSGSNKSFGTATQGVRYKVEFSLTETIIDGVAYANGGSGTLGANTVPMAIGKCIDASGGTYDNPWIGNIEDHFTIEQGGNIVADFVPYRDPSTGEMELLDLVTLTLATRVGTFTEVIEDKP